MSSEMNVPIILPEETIARLSEEVSQKHALRYVGSLEAMRKATTAAIHAALGELRVTSVASLPEPQGCPFPEIDETKDCEADKDTCPGLFVPTCLIAYGGAVLVRAEK